MLNSFSEEDLNVLRSIAVPLIENKPCDMDKVIALMNWTHHHMIFTEGETNHFPPDLIRNRKGMCDEYSLVLISLASISGYPGHLVHLDTRGGHFVTEIYVGDTWVLFDPLKNVYIKDEKGSAVSLAQIQGKPMNTFYVCNLTCKLWNNEHYDYSSTYQVYEWYGKTGRVYSSYVINPINRYKIILWSLAYDQIKWIKNALSWF